MLEETTKQESVSKSTKQSVAPRNKLKRSLESYLIKLMRAFILTRVKSTLAIGPRAGLRIIQSHQFQQRLMRDTAQLVRGHVLPSLGATPLQKLNAVHIQGLYTKLRSEGKVLKTKTGEKRSGLSEHTILHVHRVLKNLLSEAVRARLLVHNPMRDLKAPRRVIGGADKKIRALDESQIKTLLSGFSEHHLFPFVVLALATGARRGELLGLKWSDIDFKKEVLRIERSVEETSQGAKLKSTKNKSSMRRIGLDSGTVEKLQEIRTESKKNCLLLGIKFSDEHLIFPASPAKPLEPMRGYNLSKTFKYRASKIDLGNIRIHDLRHTHATQLMLAGVPVNAVASRLGHSSPAITLSVYGHVLERSEERAVEAAGRMLSLT
jgi:integrase